MAHIPRSPFATCLSGSAGETELRIRNIFQWKKQRPPLWLTALTALLIASCGGLVSCQSVTQPQGPTLTMEVQYYDALGRAVEIPRLDLPAGWAGDTAAADAVNETMAHLREGHAQTLDHPLEAQGSLCALYPTQTSRYLNLVLFQHWLDDGTSASSVLTRVYDKEENRLVTLEEALTMAGTTQEALLTTLEEDYTAQLFQDEARWRAEHPDSYSYPRVARDAAVAGFRLREEGGPEFYLSAAVGDPPGGGSHHGSQGHLFLWSQDVYTHYCCDAQKDGPAPLVPVEETMTLDSPLWCQWYFSGGEPEQLAVEAEAFQTQASHRVQENVHGEWLLDGEPDALTPAQRELLADLPAAELPREPVDFSSLSGGQVWRDTLIPLAAHREADVTLYLVVGAASQGIPGDRIAVNPQELEPWGVVLRQGERTAWFPILCDVWYGFNGWMEVGDFNGDGREEAAVCLFSGRGVGVWVEALYIFDLDSMTYTVPDCSTLDIAVAYHPQRHEAVVSSGEESLTVPLPVSVEPLKGVEVGNQVSFSCQDGQLSCTLLLDFSCNTLGYLACATTPVVWEADAYRLAPPVFALYDG